MSDLEVGAPVDSGIDVTAGGNGGTSGAGGTGIDASGGAAGTGGMAGADAAGAGGVAGAAATAGAAGNGNGGAAGCIDCEGAFLGGFMSTEPSLCMGAGQLLDELRTCMCAPSSPCLARISRASSA